MKSRDQVERNNRAKSKRRIPVPVIVALWIASPIVLGFAIIYLLALFNILTPDQSYKRYCVTKNHFGQLVSIFPQVQSPKGWAFTKCECKP
jgi:hypothetical protein